MIHSNIQISPISRNLISLLTLFLFSLSGYGQNLFFFNKKEIPTGTKAHFKIKIGTEKDTVTLPVTIFNGIEKGPVLGITAGVHGYEYPPILAAQNLIKSIDPKQLKGTVLLVQLANTPSFLQRSPFINPIDDKNLNRSFPGSKSGTITERLAHFISSEIIAPSTLFLDMHAGDASEDLMPYSAYYSNINSEGISKTGQEMATKLGFDYVVRFNTDGKTYMEKNQPSLYCSAEAFKHGIPAIDIECGGLGQTTPLLVEKIEKGVLHMMSELNMLPKSSTTDSVTKNFIINERFYMEASVDGIFYPAKKSGEFVKKGMQLGYITDFFGEITQQVYAKEDGILLLIIGTPPINKGETVAIIGKIDN